MSKKEVQVKEETALAIPMGSWGSEGLDNSDILVPKLLLMQGLSKAVVAGDATQGQVIDSLSKEVLGGITNIKKKECQKIDLIAFSSFKTWIEMEKMGDKFEYKTQYPMTPENMDQAQEGVVDGVEIRRDRCLNFYVLRPEQIAKNEALPYVISFRRTSYRAGRKIATIAAQLKAFKKPLAAKHLELSVVHMQNEQGEFWGLDITAGKVSTPQEMGKAYEWHQALATKKVNATVDDSDLRAEPAENPAQTDY